MSIIIARIKDGDERAFESIYKDYYARLFHYLKSYLNDPEEIKDVIQNTFISLWNSRESLDDDTRIYSWLYTVVRNQCLNYLRDKETRLRFQETVEAHENERFRWQTYSLQSPAHESLVRDELDQLIQSAIEDMPEGCRNVFVLSRKEDLSNREISERLNISVKTVENQITKALKILRGKLNDFQYFLFLFI